MDIDKLQKLKKKDLKDGLRVFNNEYRAWGTIRYEKGIDVYGSERFSPFEKDEDKWIFISDELMSEGYSWSSNVAKTLYYYRF